MSEQYKDSWIGINEAAEYLGVTKETIRNWIKSKTAYQLKNRKTVEV